MRSDDLRDLAESNLISGIYNYCDRWWSVASSLRAAFCMAEQADLTSTIRKSAISTTKSSGENCRTFSGTPLR